jgi:two-component system, NtrC family, response regulator HydG
MKKSQFVLIVDDDRDWAESVADLFQAYGYEVEIIANGRLAVERARRADFDIAFMDVQMPVMNGVDSFFEIRKLKPAARIVMMAGVHEPLVGRALAAGAAGLLEKPFAFERMLEIVEAAA